MQNFVSRINFDKTPLGFGREVVIFCIDLATLTFVPPHPQNLAPPLFQIAQGHDEADATKNYGFFFIP
jgi:hypothetical protein